MPGVLRAGGLPNTVALIAPHVLFLHNTGDRFDTSMVKAAYALWQAEDKLADVTIDSAMRDDANLLAFMTRADAVHRAPADKRDSLYFPPPDSEGGWRKLDSPERIHRIAGLDPKKLDEAFKMIQGSTKNGGRLASARLKGNILLTLVAQVGSLQPVTQWLIRMAITSLWAIQIPLTSRRKMPCIPL